MFWWVCRFDINLCQWPSPHSHHQCTLVAEALVIMPVVTAMNLDVFHTATRISYYQSTGHPECLTNSLLGTKNILLLVYRALRMALDTFHTILIRGSGIQRAPEWDLSGIVTPGICTVCVCVFVCLCNTRNLYGVCLSGLEWRQCHCRHILSRK